MHRSHRSSQLSTALKLETIGTGILRYGLAAVIGVIAAEKFTDFEVNNIKPLLEPIPVDHSGALRASVFARVRAQGCGYPASRTTLKLPIR